MHPNQSQDRRVRTNPRRGDPGVEVGRQAMMTEGRQQGAGTRLGLTKTSGVTTTEGKGKTAMEEAVTIVAEEVGEQEFLIPHSPSQCRQRKSSKTTKTPVSTGMR